MIGCVGVTRDACASVGTLSAVRCVTASAVLMIGDAVEKLSSNRAVTGLALGLAGCVGRMADGAARVGRTAAPPRERDLRVAPFAGFAPRLALNGGARVYVVAVGARSVARVSEGVRLDGVASRARARRLLAVNLVARSAHLVLGDRVPSLQPLDAVRMAIRAPIGSTE